MLEDFDLPAAVLAAVPEGCRVAVDLGCGTGAVLERLLPASRSLIGVDGSARMLEMCRRRFNPVDLANENRISLRIGELDHLPLLTRKRTSPASTLSCTTCPTPARACARSAAA